MSLLAMFPGQGSQSVGMGSELLKLFPESRYTFEEAEDSIKLSLRSIMLEGPEEVLRLTENQQPCLLTLEIAFWRVIAAETELEPSLMAGHSLGEYSALCAGGHLDLRSAVIAVRARGKAMQAAVPEGVGAMSAVISCPVDELEDLCKETSSPEAVVELVNYNSPKQSIVSGHQEAVKRLEEALASRSGVRVVPLPVSAPFHSSLMAPARQSMQEHLDNMQFLAGNTPVIANRTGEVVTEYSANLLSEQIDHPVLWSKSMQTAWDQGARTFLEVGPGKVLFGLARQNLPRERKLLHCEDMPALLKELS